MSDSPHWKQLPSANAGRAAVRGEELEAWLALSHDADARVRRRAAQHLCPCKVRAVEEAVWERILELVADPDASVRRAAVHAIGDGSPRDLLPHILPALEAARNDPDRAARRLVRKLLAHHHRTGKLNIL